MARWCQCSALCLYVYAPNWHVVQIFFREKKVRKNGFVIGQLGQVRLAHKKMGRLRVGQFFIQAKEFKFRLGKNKQVWVKLENFGLFCHVQCKIMHSMKHNYAYTVYSLNAYPHSKVKRIDDQEGVAFLTMNIHHLKCMSTSTTYSMHNISTKQSENVDISTPRECGPSKVQGMETLV